MTTIEAVELAALLLVALVLGIAIGRTHEPSDPPALKIEDTDAPAPPVLPDSVAIDLLVEPVVVIESGVAIAANRSARAVLGDRLIGRDVALTLRHPVLLDTVAEVGTTGRALERELAGLGTPNTAWRLRVLPDGARRLLIILEDVTQARQVDRMRADFVANASHELRTPLATISGFIETLQEVAADDAEARQRFLGIMAGEADRMRRLIDDLLSLSRIELDKFIRPTTPVSLPPLIDEVAAAMAVQLEGDARRLELDVADELPDVLADSDQINQVLTNLVANALKYGRHGTPVRLGVRRAGDMLRVTVSDEGDGIATEHLPRLTERFYRVDSQRSRKLGGTGLGLAIVKHIIERHRGTLTIDSQVGVGTTVGFTLPVAR